MVKNGIYRSSGLYLLNTKTHNGQVIFIMSLHKTYRITRGDTTF